MVVTGVILNGTGFHLLLLNIFLKATRMSPLILSAEGCVAHGEV